MPKDVTIKELDMSHPSARDIKQKLRHIVLWTPWSHFIWMASLSNIFSVVSTCADIEEGLRFRSGKTLEKLLDIESVEDCRDECQDHNECTGWVWYSLSAKGNRPKECWLKDVGKGKQKEPSIGVFSGQCTGKLFTNKTKQKF